MCIYMLPINSRGSIIHACTSTAHAAACHPRQPVSSLTGPLTEPLTEPRRIRSGVLGWCSAGRV